MLVSMNVALGGFVALMVLLFLLRKALGMFWSAAAFIALTMGYLKTGFDPPIPASVGQASNRVP